MYDLTCLSIKIGSFHGGWNKMWTPVAPAPFKGVVVERGGDADLRNCCCRAWYFRPPTSFVSINICMRLAGSGLQDVTHVRQQTANLRFVFWIRFPATTHAKSVHLMRKVVGRLIGGAAAALLPFCHHHSLLPWRLSRSQSFNMADVF